MINKHVPATTSREIRKVWDDADDQDGLRPASITIRLYANGTEIAQFVLDADNEWSWVYTAPQYEGGEEIVYTITEDEVDGYTSAIEGFVVTNTILPETGDYLMPLRGPARLLSDLLRC